MFSTYKDLDSVILFVSEDNQGSCLECGRTFLKRDDVTSDKCFDCSRSPSTRKFPSSRRHLSDFSISKLINDENTVSMTTKSPPKPSDIYDHRMFPFYNPMMLMTPPSSRYLGHDYIPLGYMPVFGSMALPEARFAPSVGGLVPRLSSGLSLADT